MSVMPRLLPLLLLLAGCAQAPSGAPSLLPRPIETRTDSEPAVGSDQVAADATLDAEIARRRAAFDAAAKSLDARLNDAERSTAVRGARTEGSDAWLAWQQRLGAVNEARVEVDAALDALDQLAIARGVEGRGGYPALDQAIAAAERVAADQQARLVRISG
jgi:hypothetical protein